MIVYWEYNQIQGVISLDNLPIIFILVIPLGIFVNFSTVIVQKVPFLSPLESDSNGLKKKIKNAKIVINLKTLLRGTAPDSSLHPPTHHPPKMDYFKNKMAATIFG